MRFISLVLILATQVSLADEVVQLKLNQPAPFAGWLFSPAKELEVRKAIIELDTTKLLLDNNTKLLTLKDQQNVLLQEQVRLWQDQSKAMAEQLVAKENARMYYFLDGAVLTTALAFAVNRATR
jgi:hypothetical protein